MVLFLTPFIAFAAWRLMFASLVPPATVVAATAVFALALVGSLLWMYYADLNNAGRTYVPAQWQNGRIIPGHAAPP